MFESEARRTAWHRQWPAPRSSSSAGLAQPMRPGRRHRDDDDDEAVPPALLGSCTTAEAARAMGREGDEGEGRGSNCSSLEATRR